MEESSWFGNPLTEIQNKTDGNYRQSCSVFWEECKKITVKSTVKL